MEKDTKHFNLNGKFDLNTLKNLTPEEEKILAEDIRKKIIDCVSKNGGHLSSNLGTVELSMAICKYFDLPDDKVIFDVSHQSYTYKLLTGRSLDNLRKENGTDGFQKISESEYDAYESGHSSDSISAAMGMAYARDLKKENFKIVVVIGDASLANGLSLEALNNLHHFNHQLLIIVNDNDMSISKPVGAFSASLRSIRFSRRYVRGKSLYIKKLSRNAFGRFIYRSTSHVKEFIQRHIVHDNVFENIGLYYYGVVDGHNIEKLCKAFDRTSNFDKPVILHIRTIKGKGYQYAEEDKLGLYHAVAPFDVNTKLELKENKTYAGYYSKLLEKAMDKDENVVSISSAMQLGTGLSELAKKYPSRCFDCGISEEHSVVFANGMAVSKLKPYVSIYSTFLQRAYDELSHDVARMNQNVTLLISNAGLVGNDGETHQGIYDVAYLSSIPNFTLLCAKDDNEALRVFDFSLSYDGPLGIRIPKGMVNKSEDSYKPLSYKEYDMINENDKKDVCIVTYGPVINEILKRNKDITICNTIFLLPVNEEKLKELNDYKKIIIYDPYSTKTGYSTFIENAFYKNGFKNKLVTLAIPDTFVAKGSIEEQLRRYHLDIDSLFKVIGE